MSRRHWIEEVRRRLGSMVMALVVIVGTVMAITVTSAAPARADDGGYPSATMACVWAPYSADGTRNTNWCKKTDAQGNIISDYDWGTIHDNNGSASELSIYGYYYRNCVDYVAWKVSTLGVSPNQYKGLGNAKDWPTNAPGKGLTVDTTPAVGSAVVNTSGTYGHVAYVASVNADNTITVSEYNHGADGYYGTRTGTFSGLGFSQVVHFEKYETSSSGGSGGSTPPPPPSQPDLLLVTVGTTLYSKVNIGDQWVTQTNAATSVKASGGRIGITDTAGNLEVKDGPNGAWVTETGAVDQYVVTPNLLVIRVGGTVYAKAALTDAWATEVGGGATSIQAADNTLALLDSSGNLWAKVGVGGTWQQEIGSVSEFVLTSSLLVAKVGTTLYAKANIGDGWTTETNAATQVKASGGRMAIVDTSGNVEVKDGINGAWVTETRAVDQYIVTPNLLVIRVGGTVYAKVQLTDAWTTETTSAANVQATNNTMAYLDTGGNLWAQVGTGGGWLNEIGSVGQFVVS